MFCNGGQTQNIFFFFFFVFRYTLIYRSCVGCCVDYYMCFFLLLYSQVGLCKPCLGRRVLHVFFLLAYFQMGLCRSCLGFYVLHVFSVVIFAGGSM